MRRAPDCSDSARPDEALRRSDRRAGEVPLEAREQRRCGPEPPREREPMEL
jgi:hypothetical protein